MNSKFYQITIEGLQRELPLCPVNDKLDIAAFVIFGDVEMTVACAKGLLAKAPEFDYIIVPEAKGIPLCYEMARQSGKGYYVARKSVKVYTIDPICVEVRSITTARTQTLYLSREEADAIKGKRVLIVDDVVSTGESLAALEKLIDAAGGIVAAKAAILAEGDAQDRDDIIYLEKLPIFFYD